ncbi:hypothetical protein BC827DRAFT_1158707 [Russula dissimulans]|nr:hypothetical protein BC827DRAFT_1158707 [Russula dissimulans]
MTPIRKKNGVPAEHPSMHEEPFEKWVQGAPKHQDRYHSHPKGRGSVPALERGRDSICHKYQAACELSPFQLRAGLKHQEGRERAGPRPSTKTQDRGTRTPLGRSRADEETPILTRRQGGPVDQERMGPRVLTMSPRDSEKRGPPQAIPCQRRAKREEIRPWTPQHGLLETSRRDHPERGGLPLLLEEPRQA